MKPRRVCALFFSPTGGTRRAALLLAEELAAQFGVGWEEFTDAAIAKLNTQDRPIVFILWGKPAQEKAKMLTNPKHLVLKAPHPSPLSAYRGFFGSKPFSQTNDFLIKNGEVPIQWEIPEKIENEF